ncbi:MAG TPA: hypothetical protein VLI21_15410 [Casimicrobiaceae bacterium]|nr:hypothetical protein [Casimicrobiaceae bacterium]
MIPPEKDAITHTGGTSLAAPMVTATISLCCRAIQTARRCGFP